MNIDLWMDQGPQSQPFCLCDLCLYLLSYCGFLSEKLDFFKIKNKIGLIMFEN